TALIAALSHPERDVRQAAGSALAALQTDHPLIDIVSRVTDGRLGLTPELIGSLASQERVKLLAADNPAARRVAIEVMVEKKDVAATGAVLERVGDPDPEVALAAIVAVGELGESTPEDDKSDPRLLWPGHDHD